VGKTSPAAVVARRPVTSSPPTVSWCILFDVGEIHPMPRLGDVFDDVRDNGRTMRISCHTDRDAVVVSLWHETLCRGSFRLAADDLDRLLATLAEMNSSLRPAPMPAATGDGGATPGGTAPEPVAAPGDAPDREQPRPEQTGDITGAASFGGLLPPPALRVA